MADLKSFTPAEALEVVKQIKESWRKSAATMSWEEKIAAIERMRERDAIIRREREAWQKRRGDSSPQE